MHKTTTAICDWLEAHPESQPKTRRFGNIISPPPSSCTHYSLTCRGSRVAPRPSAGTSQASCLNQAYENLYNNLLSDVAMDISSEDCRFGMLANDEP